MALITIPDKNTGDDLTAAEFNEILDALKDGTLEVNASGYQVAGVALQSSDLSDGSSLLKNVSEDTSPTLGGNLDAGSFNITNVGNVDGRDLSADGTKLDGIESGADVTDTTNVTAAGALMDSELTDIAAVKALNQGVATTDSPTFVDITTDHLATEGTIGTKGLFLDEGTFYTAGNPNGTASSSVDTWLFPTTVASPQFTLKTSSNSGSPIIRFIAPDSGGTYVQGQLDFDPDNDRFDIDTGVSITGNITVTGTVDGRDVASDGSKLDGIEAGADVTDTTNVTAAGALMDSELTSIASVKALDQGVATTDSPTFDVLTLTSTLEGPRDMKLNPADGSGTIAFQLFRDINYTTGTGPYFYINSGYGTFSPWATFDAANERLGLGVTSPLRKLDLVGSMVITDGATDAFLFNLDGTDLEFWYQSTYSSGDSGWAQLLHLEGDTGRLGIGTATPAALLDLNGDSKIRGDMELVNAAIISNSDVRIDIDTNNNGSNTFSVTAHNNASTLLSLTDTGDLTVDTDTLFVDASTDRVGVGTTSPSEALEVNNTVVFSSVYDNGNSGTSDTIDWGNGNMQKSTLTGNVTFSFTAPGSVGRFSIRLIQDGTGSRTVTWPAAVRWPGGTAPTLSTAAGAVDIITFEYDGTNYDGVSSIGFS